MRDRRAAGLDTCSGTMTPRPSRHRPHHERPHRSFRRRSTATRCSAQADALHDDEPQRALELLRALDAATLLDEPAAAAGVPARSRVRREVRPVGRGAGRPARVVQQAGAQATPAVFRHAAIAAQIAGDVALARAWTQALAASSDAPLAKARALVTLGAVGFSVSRQGAEIGRPADAAGAAAAGRAARVARRRRWTPRSARSPTTWPRSCWSVRSTTSPSPTCAPRCT